MKPRTAGAEHAWSRRQRTGGVPELRAWAGTCSPSAVSMVGTRPQCREESLEGESHRAWQAARAHKCCWGGHGAGSWLRGQGAMPCTCDMPEFSSRHWTSLSGSNPGGSPPGSALQHPSRSGHGRPEPPITMCGRDLESPLGKSPPLPQDSRMHHPGPYSPDTNTVTARLPASCETPAAIC